MIQRYDTTQQKRVDVSQIRRYDGSKWVDVQFVRRYDGSKWVDAFAREYEFENLGYSTKVNYTANGSTATVELHGESEYCRIGVAYVDSAGVVFENPVLKGVVTSSSFSNGEMIGDVNITDHYTGAINTKTEYIYNGTAFNVSFNGDARVIEVVVRSLSKSYASIQLSNFTLNGIPVKFI